jgi:hypothetical protein
LISRWIRLPIAAVDSFKEDGKRASNPFELLRHAVEIRDKVFEITSPMSVFQKNHLLFTSRATHGDKQMERRNA